VAGSAERPTVFISYSHQDRQWLARLRVHLKPLERDFAIDIWDDSRIEPGTNWKNEIALALQSANVAVLLVSADFLGSDFIASDELPPLLNAAEGRGTRIIPVHLSASRFRKTPGLAQFQSINDPATPLVSVPVGEQEAVFVKLADAIEAYLFAGSGRAATAPSGSPTGAQPASPSVPAVLPAPVEAALDEIRQEIDKAGREGDKPLASQIARFVFVAGLQAIAGRAHPKRLAGNLERALGAALAAIAAGSRPLYGGDEWRTLTFASTDPIATLVMAVTRNREVTDEIVKAMKEMSSHGPIHLREPFGDWTLELRPGFQMGCGIVDEPFVTHPTWRVGHAYHPYIFMTGETLSRQDDVAAMIGHDQRYDIGGIVIVAKDFDGAVLGQLPREVKKIDRLEYGEDYARESIESVLAIKAPEDDRQREALLNDLRVVTGARPLRDQRGRASGAVDHLQVGRADRVLSIPGHTAVIAGRGGRSAIESHIVELSSALERTTDHEQRQTLEERVHRLRAAIAVVDAGRRFRDDDAKGKRVWPLLHEGLRALERAGADGIATGDGLALANAAQAIRRQDDLIDAGEAVALLAAALETPMKARAEEVGRDSDELLREVRQRQVQAANDNIGYHSDQDAFVDLFSAGVIVPTAVLRATVRLAVDAAARKLKEIRFNDELVKQIGGAPG
jgi:chaperonin GroEL (HSP60 family)